jgi:hypothetical protein
MVTNPRASRSIVPKAADVQIDCGARRLARRPEGLSYIGARVDFDDTSFV